jgi:L-sorbose 1-phosphate reductase
MLDKLVEYKRADASLPEKYSLWPLYGAGFENLGRDGEMIEVPLPEYGPDELLVRHDACGICFSDIKVIRSGQNHPRIYRDMRQDPVVLGHEVILTVVGIGEDLQAEYEIGDRFIVQADIYVDGVGYAYGYEIQGGFSQYNRIDQRVLNGDGGNYLLPVQETTGYAEAALNEPWACVEASYIVQYRSAWKEGGAVWIVGDGSGVALGRAANWRPALVVVDANDAEFAAGVLAWAQQAGIPVVEDDGERQYDDIVVLSSDPELIERTFARLAKGGLFNVVTAEDVPRRVQLDIGRLHYDNLGIVGATDGDLSSAYQPIRTQLKPGGQTWILGAGGPMGHMHLQRALEIEDRPRKVAATNVHLARIGAVEEKFIPTAKKNNVELTYHSQESFPSAEALMETLRKETGGDGFDDIAVMAPSVPAVEMAMDLMADNGVMNVFAGLPRGTMAMFDMNDIVQRGVRFTGTSGSSIEDLQYMLDLTESRALETNRSVVAVAGLEGVPDGLRAVADGRFSGKVVIWPNLGKPLGLTTLEELEDVLPTVYAKLDENGEWTREAEEEFLRQML